MCGERFLSEADFDFKHFLFHHVPHELVHWDGKLGLTLRELILAPGEMATQFARGRRQPYLNPLRLYLVVFLVQAFLSGIGVREFSLSERLQIYDVTGLVARYATSHPAAAGSESVQNPHSASYAHWTAEAGTLVIVFLTAWVQLAIFWKYRRRYLEHLTLALNVVTFSMLVLIIGDIVTLIAGKGAVTDTAWGIRNNTLAYTLPFYWFFAIRRFYGTTWGGAIGYAIVITAAGILIAIGLNEVLLFFQVAAARA